MNNETEILDSVDTQGRVIGSASREEFHSNPALIHAVVHCWIVNGKGQVLLQKRAKSKHFHPGCWDISCAGHVSHGETPGQTIERELAEELGVKAAHPVLVCKYVQKQQEQTELIYLYYLRLELSESDFTLQTAELDQVRWFDLKDAFSVTEILGDPSTHWITDQLPRILQLALSKFIS